MIVLKSYACVVSYKSVFGWIPINVTFYKHVIYVYIGIRYFNK